MQKDREQRKQREENRRRNKGVPTREELRQKYFQNFLTKAASFPCSIKAAKLSPDANMFPINITNANLFPVTAGTKYTILMNELIIIQGKLNHLLFQ